MANVKEYNVDDLKKLIEEDNISALISYMSEYNLEVKNGRIVPINKKYYMDQSEYWDMQQLIAKIKLNSLYGCILNEHSKFYDSRIGQSVTLTGRQVVKHLSAKINELITGVYDHLGASGIYGDTDSYYFSVYNAWKDSQSQKITISSREQFDAAFGIFVKVLNNPDDVEILNEAVVLKSLTPEQIETLEIALQEEEMQNDIEAYDEWVKIVDQKIEQSFPPIEYETSPAKPVNSKFGHLAANFDWTDKEAIIKLYDEIADEANTTFAEFMNSAFNTGLERGEVIAAGREIVAENALFLKKKRYAALIIDSDGKRQDIDGKPGKLKAMGLETRRSDTPTVIQEFLEEVLIKTLKGIPEPEVLKFIKDFADNFKSQPGYKKGRPSSIKGLTKYNNKLDAAVMDDFDDGDTIEMVDGKVNMPGHVRAAINFNNMLKIMNDKSIAPIKDGDKIVVCQLKQNPYAIDNIARPVDVSDHILPKWFTELPFDHETMEKSMIDVKVDNIIGILGWDLQSISSKSTFNDLFTATKLPPQTKQPEKKKEKSKKDKVVVNDSLFS